MVSVWEERWLRLLASLAREAGKEKDALCRPASTRGAWFSARSSTWALWGLLRASRACHLSREKREREKKKRKKDSLAPPLFSLIGICSVSSSRTIVKMGIVLFFLSFHSSQSPISTESRTVCAQLASSRSIVRRTDGPTSSTTSRICWPPRRPSRWVVLRTPRALLSSAWVLRPSSPTLPSASASASSSSRTERRLLLSVSFESHFLSNFILMLSLSSSR